MLKPVEPSKGAGRLVRELAEGIANYYYRELVAALEAVVRQCLGELFSRVEWRRRVAESVLRGYAGWGLLELRCNGDICTAVIDEEALDEPDAERLEEVLEETLLESDVMDALIAETARCVLGKLEKLSE